MKRKNGFTLIELLAVIVILAIIAVIAVPIVINIIDDSKKSASLRSADFYLDAVENSIATATLSNKKIENGVYSIMKDGNICLETLNPSGVCVGENDRENNGNDILKVEVIGEKSTKGTITIDNGKIIHAEIKINKKEIIKDSRGKIAYARTLNEVCTPAPSREQLYANNPLESGYKYECKVKDVMEEEYTNGYTFYVLNTRNAKGEIITTESKDQKAVSLNLIMNTNINSDGTPIKKAIKQSQASANKGIYNLIGWVNQTDYESVGGKKWNDWTDNNYFGPITVMNFISEATKNWTNINQIVIDSFDSYNWNSILINEKNAMKKYYTYARLPYYNEVKNASTNKMWLIDYLHGDDDIDKGVVERVFGISDVLGYWTLSSYSSNPSYAWRVNYLGEVGYAIIYSNGVGVRPVINLQL